MQQAGPDGDTVEAHGRRSAASARRLLWAAAILSLALIVVVPGVVGAKKKKKKPSNLSQSLSSLAVSFPNASTATAACAGKRHIGFGGFQVNTEFPFGSGVAATVESAGPATSKLWEARARNDFAAEAGTLTSFAYCAKGKAPKLVSTISTLPADDGVPPAESAKLLTAQCPTGRVLTGAGWRISGDNPNDNRHVIPIGLERSPADNRTVNVSLVNENLTPVTATVTAICRKGKVPVAVELITELAEPEQKSATVTCPGKKKVVFGGYSGELDPLSTENALPYAMFRPTLKSITVSAGQTSFGPNLSNTSFFKAIAYCG